MTPHAEVPLAPRTSLGVGGPARRWVSVTSHDELVSAVRWARDARLPLRVLSGGSNLVVADRGVEALVVELGLTGVEWSGRRVRIQAGTRWDDVVREACARGLGGIECLSGIPGGAGATPIQNVGAYGQEIADRLVTVDVLDVEALAPRRLTRDECAFAYRDSRFKGVDAGRFVVTSLELELEAEVRPPRYAELAAHLDGRGITQPSASQIRESVLVLRAGKSMLLDESDPNGRSCGSFFTNPIVSDPIAAEVERRVPDARMPRFAERDGRTKLSAGWLIERAGLPKGLRDGAVGISTRHALALVAHAGATAADVLRLASRVRSTVLDAFGVKLVPEPVFWGFDQLDDGLPVA